ncbi:MAG: hypothetical protein HFJ60_04210 [Clostridia bacterium]|jgi:hypothetical protein|nr:hypothetical protein [Clostridia bacterium]
MELENATIIDFGEVELLANKEELYMGFKNEAKFKINWCRLKDKPDQLICLNIECDKLSEEIKEKEIPIVNITEMIRLQFMELLEKELNSFIGKNINNISYFFEKDEYTDANRNKYYANPEFLKISDIGIDFFNENASIEQKSKVHTSFCIYDEINKSKLKYKPSAYYSEKIVEIDMKENKILTEPSTIMNLVYSEVDLCKILAYKQYELGITPPFYNEIAKINRFLKDKKTITVLLKDNTEIKIEADITDIIDFYNGVFSINRNLLNLSYDEANREKVDINNLKALRHGKTEISINTENLKPLEQQLDEIIHNENKGIICNITNQELENEDQGDTNEI